MEFHHTRATPRDTLTDVANELLFRLLVAGYGQTDVKCEVVWSIDIFDAFLIDVILVRFRIRSPG